MEQLHLECNILESGATEIWNHCLWRIKEELDKGKYVGIAVSRIPYNIGVFVGDRYFIKFKKAIKVSNHQTIQRN